MARSYQDVQALKASSDVKQVEQEVQALPPGYVSGGDLTLNSDSHIEVDPFVLNIKSKKVTLNETYTIVDGDFLYSRVPGCTYTVYVDDAGLFRVDALEAEYESDFHAYYHPNYNNYRALGKFHINDSNVIDYAFPTMIRKIAVTDDESRYIEISADKGLYAEDASGTVIHDIPDAAIISGWTYGGHVLFMSGEYSVYDNLSLIDGEDDAQNATASAVSNFDISTYTEGLSNVHGALIRCGWSTFLGPNKMDSSASMVITIGALYSNAYDTAPPGYAIMCYEKDTPGGLTYFSKQGQNNMVVPVVYNASTPYITWSGTAQMQNMASASGYYGVGISVYILGFLI